MGHLGTLFERPDKWTAHHQDLLQVKESQVSSERLIGSAFLPQDGDQEFEAIAADFAKPTREDFLDGTIYLDYTPSPFWNIFNRLGQMMRLEGEAKGDELCSDYYRTSRLMMESLINILLGQVSLETWL